MIRIKLKAFAHLRDFLQKEQEVALKDDECIQTLMDSLCTQHSGLRGRLFEHDGKLKHMVIVLKNGRNILHLEGLETTVENGDTICLFPPVAGG